MFSAVGGLGREGWVSVSHIPLGWPGWHPWSPPTLLVTGKPDGLQLGPQVGAGVRRSRAERGVVSRAPPSGECRELQPQRTAAPSRPGDSTPPGPGISVHPEL